VRIAKHVGIIGGIGWLGNAMESAGVETGLIEPALLILSSQSGAPGNDSLAGARRCSNWNGGGKWVATE
jgi:hypothetical protein